MAVLSIALLQKSAQEAESPAQTTLLRSRWNLALLLAKISSVAADVLLWTPVQVQLPLVQCPARVLLICLLPGRCPTLVGRVPLGLPALRQ